MKTKQVNSIVNINPTSEELEQVLKTYREQESLYPAAKPPAPNKALYYLLIFITILTLPLVLVILILRPPLIITRKLRLSYLEKKEEAWFRSEMDWDPDTEGREFHFNEPDTKQTPQEKQLDAERRHLNSKTEELKQQWLEDTNDYNKLMDYAVYLSTTNYYNGPKNLLFILNQVLQMHDAEIKQDYLYWNLCVACNKLKLPNQSQHYQQLAIQNGFNAKKYLTHSKFGFLTTVLLFESWNYFYKDLINVWPRLR